MPRDVQDWLIKVDPSMEWQVLRDLQDEPKERYLIARARVPHSGWGEALLERQRPDGSWAADEPSGWADSPDGSATYALSILRLFEIDPDDSAVRAAIDRVHEGVTYIYQNPTPYFGGETEVCVNGMVLANAGYFHVEAEGPAGIADRLLGQQLEDGGWNCDAPGSRRGSFHSTLCVLEGLLAWNRWRPDPRLREALDRGIEYLMLRGAMHRLSTGEIVDSSFLVPASPPGWHYDIVRALDFLRDASVVADDRLGAALDHIETLRADNGRWQQGALHPGLDGEREREHWAGRAPGVGESVGTDSPVITLRARRILRWAGREA
ncbi:MAG: hypothetical protein ACXIUP_10340 [Microcella sp.]